MLGVVSSLMVEARATAGLRPLEGGGAAAVRRREEEGRVTRVGEQDGIGAAKDPPPLLKCQ